MSKILQLSSDFQYQKFYPNLIKGLDSKNIEQVVYLQKREEEAYSELCDVKNTIIIQSFQYKTWMKFFFKRRIGAITSDIEKSVKLTEISLTVSYFLFTDGAVANELFKKYRIPYIVAIRNSDINHYFKYRFWLKDYIKEVMINASRIIFPSPSYIDTIKIIIGEVFFNTIVSNKIEVVGNIIDDSWFKNVESKSILKDEVRLLYAGEFSKNKRLENIISSFHSFSKRYNCRLYLVGNYGNYVDKINQMTESCKDIEIIDKIEDVDKLISIFDQCHIFVMPSRTETFGNVYVEAMARGLPIVYTKGQGIDGYFSDGKVGFGVSEPLDRNILNSLERIIQNYNIFSLNAIECSKHFTKKVIIDRYINIFREVIE